MEIAGTIRKYPRKAIALVLLLNALMHLPYISLPPCSIHVWRQCNTLAVTRNFFEEDSNLFRPRVDNRGTGDGVTGMQFPAFEWLLSRIYHVTGESFTAQRLYALAISSLAIVLMFFFLYEVGKDSFFAFAGAWCMTWSPEFFYHGINALPDIAALMFSLGACYGFMRWTRRGGRRLFALTFLMLTIAGLIKIQYFMITAFMAGTLWILRKETPAVLYRERIKSFVLMVIISGAIIMSWYIYAINLIRISGLTDFGLTIRPARGWNEGWSILKRNLVSDLPELLLNYASFILFVIVLFMIPGFRIRQRAAAGGFLLLALAYVNFHLLELHQMKVHQYYMLPALIFLAPMAGAGAVILYKKQSLRWIALLLLIAGPVLAAIRIIPARWQRDDKGIPVAFTSSQDLHMLRMAVPEEMRIITGPDPSGCIFFYFLDKKGYAYPTAESLDTISNLSEKFKGAYFIYTHRHDFRHPDAKLMYTLNDWRIYSIVR